MKCKSVIPITNVPPQVQRFMAVRDAYHCRQNYPLATSTLFSLLTQLLRKHP